MEKWDIHMHRFMSMLLDARPPGSQDDCNDGASVYSGCLGRAYAALHSAWAIQRVIDASKTKTDASTDVLRAWKSEMLDISGRYVDGSVRAKLSNKDRAKHSFLCGCSIGRHVIIALLESEKYRDDNSDQRRQCVSKINNAVGEVVALEASILSNDHETEHELMNGTSGWLYALLLIRAAVVNGKHLVTIELIERAALYITNHGQRYVFTAEEVGKSDGSDRDSIRRVPLQYKWHDKLYLGAAHGLCGIIVVLLDSMDAMRDVGESIFEEALKAIGTSVRLTITYILALRLPSGNLRTRPDSDRDRLVQWCHGAVGMGLMLVRCAETLGDDFNPLGGVGKAAASPASRFLDRNAFLVEADVAASLVSKTRQQKIDSNTWKGPGLCHGASGSAYLFLKLFDLTGRQEYLDEAELFASMLIAWPDESLLPNDRPYSLFEGVSGALCLLADLKAAHTNGSFFPGFGLPEQHH
eukprot:g1608.t1